MSTNPNNAVGTNAAYDGRTSVKAFNDGIGAYSAGILSGWACSPNTGMTVSLGGDGTTRDIAIAEDVSGNKITVNNISESPISVTMSAAPSTNSRIDLIVAYVDNPPQGSSTSVDNPGACGLIKVDGTAAADPVAPNDSAIRTAITADGASGSTAYYVVLATITIASGTTDLTSSNIAAGPSSGIGSQNIDFTTFGGTLGMVRISDEKTVGGTFTDYGSTTITKTGLYFITLYVGSGSAGSTEMRSEIRAYRNSTELFACGAWSIKNYAGNNFAEANMSECYWLQEGDVIKVQVRNRNWTGETFGQMDVKCIY